MCNHDYVNLIIKLVPHARNLTYYASIMLILFHAYYAENYAGIISTGLICGQLGSYTNVFFPDRHKHLNCFGTALVSVDTVTFSQPLV